MRARLRHLKAAISRKVLRPQAQAERRSRCKAVSGCPLADLPPGFTLDAPASGLPPGFTLDATPKKTPQKGLINEARSALEHTGPIGLGVGALLPGEPETAAGKFTKKAFELPEKLADKAGEKTAEA